MSFVDGSSQSVSVCQCRRSLGARLGADLIAPARGAFRVPDRVEIGARDGIVRIDAQGIFKIGLRPLEISLLEVNGAETSVSLVIVRFEAQHRFEFRLRLAPPVLPEVKSAQAGVRLIIVRTKLDGGAQMVQGFGGSTKGNPGHAQSLVGGAVIRISP